MPGCGPVGAGHPIPAKELVMADPVEFQPEITLSKDEALDLVAGCDEMVAFAEAAGELELAFTVEGMRRLVLGRLLGEPGDE
jgi:hypothetical protein